MIHYYYFVGGPLSGCQVPENLSNLHRIDIEDFSEGSIFYLAWKEWNSHLIHRSIRENQSYYITKPVVVGDKTFHLFQHEEILTPDSNTVMQKIIFGGLSALRRQQQFIMQ